MNFNNLPPSYRFQRWGLIFSLLIVVGLFAGGLFLYISWGWIAPVGSMKDHLDFLQVILVDFLTQRGLV